MKYQQTIIPPGAVRRLIKSNISSRISEKALFRITQLSEEYVIRLARHAERLAKHTKRNTILLRDVDEALKWQESDGEMKT